MRTEHTADMCGLDEIAVGESATVLALYGEGTMRRRLCDIGLITGSTVECIGRSPCKDPSAYRISGAVIAIRRQDAKNVWVKRHRKGE